MIDTSLLDQINSFEPYLFPDEKLVEKYEGVGKVVDENGNILSHGANWLEGIEDSRKAGLARLYHKAAEYILYVGGIKLPKGFDIGDMIIFPMLRRIYTLLDYEFDFKQFLKYFYNTWSEVLNTWDITNAVNEFDYEAELTQMVAEKITIKFLENKNKKMYKQVNTYEQVEMENGALVTPVASLESQHGGVAHFIIDDNCYVLILKRESGYISTSWIFKEAFEVLKNLPSLN
jgi:hypothetical protein